MRDGRSVFSGLHFRDVGNESIAVALDGDDVFVVSGGVAEGFAEGRDIAGEVGVFDDVAVPDLFDQFVLFEQAAGIFDEGEQDVEDPSGHVDVVAVARQCPVVWVDLECVESIMMTVR